MINAMIRLVLSSVLLLVLFGALCVPIALAEEQEENADAGEATIELRYAYGVMCENIENFRPVNPSAVFSVSSGRVMCFTEFDRVPYQTDIYHDWIKRGELVFRKKLVLKPPSWSSVSSIQLREADKGPWRVEVRGDDGRLLKLLRFSITD